MRAAAACGDLRLGVEGDAKTGRLDHREVVCAVAGRQRFLRRKAEPRS